MNPPNITLKPITGETVRQITDLAVRPDQARFVASNAVSLAQALFRDVAWYRAIYADEEPVGFVMLADETLQALRHDNPGVCLWRFMIDARHQRRGIGREAMRLIIDHVRSRPDVQRFYTSYVPGDGCPEPFYRSLGFQPNGEKDDGEIVLVYPLSREA